MPQINTNFNYEVVVTDVINSGLYKGLESSGIYDRVYSYKNDPLKSRFQEFYNNWQTALCSWESLLGITTCRLIFLDNKVQFNAVAGPCEGISLIGINSKVITKTDGYFTNVNFHTKRTKLKYLVEAENTFYNSIPSLMADFCIGFVIAHEFGHIIQSSSAKATIVKREYSGSVPAFKMSDHILEFDADWRGACHLVGTSLDYWQYCKRKTNQSLEVIISMAVASVLFSFEELIGFPQEFYLAQTSHPHHSVRIRYILNFLKALYVSNVPKQDLDWELILDRAFDIHREFRELNGNCTTSVYQNITSEKSDEIDRYIFTLSQYAKGTPNLCINRPGLPNITYEMIESLIQKMPKYTNIDMTTFIK
ncbi:hypothetical protein PV783_32925 [Chitinophaga sp. CC14]|uniref:hypothetical protein n=1 Tax=Chitinophaga sp. CC14 TaxID=3029199 RepID=UPI003B78484B